MSERLDATAMAQLVGDGEVTAGELVEQAIARAEAVNPQLNAIIHPRFDAARREAAVETSPPFLGVPMVVKDLDCAIAGEPHHQGVAALRDADLRAPHDSFLYESFCRAGLVAIGRTNTPELGTTVTTEPLAYGPTRNPWDLDHSTGGSSGGSAAAVAAGIAPIGHANDGGGSIRVPAANCGLVGLKPTRARVSKGPDIGEGWAGATIDGVVTLSIRDTAAVLDAISGYRPGDPYTAPPPRRPFRDEVGADPGPLRVGLVTHDDDLTIHEECRAAVESTGRLLESMGHSVDIAQPDAFRDPDFGENFGLIVLVATARDVELMGEAIGRPLDETDVEPANWFFVELARSVTATAYLAAVGWMHSWQRRMAAWWHDDGYDLLVSPVLASPPPPIGWLSDPERGMDRLAEIFGFTAQFNMTGQPAISLPLHWSADGLPIGVQLAAAYGREDTLIALGSQLEQAQPWADRRPPVYAGG